MPGPSSREKFLKYLENDAAEYFDGGRTNNLIDLSLTIATIISSLIAAVVAASDTQRWVRVAIAAVPAACTSLQKVAGSRARSNWYFDYAARLRALAVTLEFASNPNLEDFAKKRSDIDLDVERAWSQIGRGGAKPVMAHGTKKNL